MTRFRFQRWMFSIRLLLPFIIIIIILPTITLAGSPGWIIFPWGFRGGSAHQHSIQHDDDIPARISSSPSFFHSLSSTPQSEFLSIGVIRWNHEMNEKELKNQTNHLPACLMIASNEPMTMYALLLSTNETTMAQVVEKESTNATAMMETLAVTCDIVFLIMKRGGSDVHGGISPPVVEALLQGVQRRRRHDAVRRSTIVVVIPTENHQEDSHVQAWKDHVALHDMAAVTPDLVERLEIVTSRELDQLWNELVVDPRPGDTESSSNPSEFDVEMFPTLLQDVYRSLSGDQDADVVLHDVVNGTKLAAKQPVVIKARQSTNTALLIQQVKWEAQRRLEQIETRQEQIWLDDTSSPMLEFGSIAEQILNDAQFQLQSINHSTDDDDDECHQVLMQLAMDLRRLYQLQLQALREHYGRRYDMILESTKDERRWTAAAVDATERFRIAAQHAIPTLCRQDNLLRDADFNYLPSLHGLISDMTQATALRQDLETALTEDLDNIDDDNDDDDNVSSSKRRNKWYHKLAARCLVLGVNYVQGWLAWKAIQRAADERDRNIPKFPLF